MMRWHVPPAHPGLLHLKELRNAGLIDCEKISKQVYCRINRQLLQELGDFLGED